MSERPIFLKPLVAGDFRMEPQHCKENLGSGGCVRKIKGGRCPTGIKTTGTCGGWKPRNDAVPTWAVFDGKLDTPDTPTK